MMCVVHGPMALPCPLFSCVLLHSVSRYIQYLALETIKNMGSQSESNYRAPSPKHCKGAISHEKCGVQFMTSGDQVALCFHNF